MHLLDAMELYCYFILFLFSPNLSDATKRCGIGLSMTTYDDSDKFCCNGKVYDKSNQTGSFSCCNVFINQNVRRGNVFNEATHLCCGSVLIPKDHTTKELGCCGSRHHEEGNGMCCEGVFYEHYEDGQTCCGPKLMKRGDECCDGKLHRDIAYSNVRCCKKEIYNEDSHYCFNYETILSYGEEICNGVIFKTKLKTCCKDVLRPKEHGKDYCCGSVPYSREEFECDSQHERLIPWGQAWCEGAEQFYTKGTEICCGKKVSNRINTDQEQCCGDQELTEKHQGCCNNNEIYDKVNDVCCGGKIFKPTETRQCCGNVEIDPRRALCCVDGDKNVPVNKVSFHENKCCTANGTQLYDHHTHQCTPNGIEALVEDIPTRSKRNHKENATYTNPTEITTSNEGSKINHKEEDKSDRNPTETTTPNEHVSTCEDICLSKKEAIRLRKKGFKAFTLKYSKNAWMVRRRKKKSKYVKRGKDNKRNKGRGNRRRRSRHGNRQKKNRRNRWRQIKTVLPNNCQCLKGKRFLLVAQSIKSGVLIGKYYISR